MGTQAQDNPPIPMNTPAQLSERNTLTVKGFTVKIHTYEGNQQ
jgi:hypothetical protein